MQSPQFVPGVLCQYLNRLLTAPSALQNRIRIWNRKAFRARKAVEEKAYKSIVISNLDAPIKSI